MQSLQSFINRNNFNASMVHSLIKELGIETVKDGKAEFLMKDSANELRSAYFEKTKQAS